MSFELKPLNKYIVIEPIDEADKVGSIYVPGNVTNSYRMARVIAVSKCDETEGMTAGSKVLYDTLGEIRHRVGNQTFITVKAVNVIGLLKHHEGV